MNDKFQMLRKFYQIEEELEFREWAQKMPFFNLPQNISIAVIPPFGGAVARFRLRHEITQKQVSVYFDAYQALGFYGNEPYWELYPNMEGDVSRYDFNNIDGLIKEAIEILGYDEIWD